MMYRTEQTSIVQSKRTGETALLVICQLPVEKAEQAQRLVDVLFCCRAEISATGLDGLTLKLGCC